MNIQAAKPNEMGNDARQEFIAFVQAAAEVDPDTLPDLVDRAAYLLTLRDGETLVGTLAIKTPYAGHHQAVFGLAGVPDQAAQYPFELGWLHVHKDHQGQGLSHRLMASAIACAGDDGLYATTKTAAMHVILPAHGFRTLGSPYASALEADGQVTLFCRDSATPGAEGGLGVAAL
jgi:GNAT superfamily N-acetyltransferase